MLFRSAPVYSHSGDSSNQSSGKTEKRGFYKHLMNGVSNMLPFVVGGGILIAISFMFGIHSAEINDPNEYTTSVLWLVVSNHSIG